MVHVWERRDDQTWLSQPNGPAQRAKDTEFVSAGDSLLQSLLVTLGGNAANGYNNWLPRATTTVHVIAPAANPDYDDPRHIQFFQGNPWYTREGGTRNGLIYQNAADSLLTMATRKVGCIDRGEVLTYRRRFSNDIDHGTDDRDKIALVPYILNRHTYVNLMWDDNRLKPVTQIN